MISPFLMSSAMSGMYVIRLSDFKLWICRSTHHRLDDGGELLGLRDDSFQLWCQPKFCRFGCRMIIRQFTAICHSATIKPTYADNISHRLAHVFLIEVSSNKPGNLSLYPCDSCTNPP